jgi:tetratricopeptide (TPR) repeat protein
LVKGAGGDGASQFRLRDFAFAGNPKTGTRIFDRPATAPARRSRQTKSRQEKFLQQIAAHEEFLTTHKEKDAVHAKKTEELSVAKKKRAGILIEEAKKRLERNPTDLQLRFELGEHLVNAQRFREAVSELQRARQNPNARLKAMNMLGICYRELGMLDLAMKQFEDAAKEILTMDAMKKEIVYNLAIVYEKMGEREKSLNCMKQIYEADYGYKDVAERVESSYQQG